LHSDTFTLIGTVDFLIVGWSVWGGGAFNFEPDGLSNRRLDAGILGLSYGLNESTNLLGAWNYVGNAYETGSADIDLYFESVANTIPALLPQSFINLEIQEGF